MRPLVSLLLLLPWFFGFIVITSLMYINELHIVVRLLNYCNLLSIILCLYLFVYNSLLCKISLRVVLFFIVNETELFLLIFFK